MITRRVFISTLLSATLFKSAQAENTKIQKLVAAAKSQIGVTTSYDPAYVKLAFPGGDVPRATGVCTDVIIRAYRDGLKLDLQKLVNADMAKNFSSYPKRWSLKKPDRNIDHRRVPNLQKFFVRFGTTGPASSTASDYKAGDIVTMMLPGNLPHIAIVSDEIADSGRPLLIHNIGRGTQAEDLLFSYPVTGHYRYGLT